MNVLELQGYFFLPDWSILSFPRWKELQSTEVSRGCQLVKNSRADIIVSVLRSPSTSRIGGIFHSGGHFQAIIPNVINCLVLKQPGLITLLNSHLNYTGNKYISQCSAPGCREKHTNRALQLRVIFLWNPLFLSHSGLMTAFTKSPHELSEPKE